MVSDYTLWMPQHEPTFIFEIPIEKAKDRLIYGADIIKVTKWGKWVKKRFYIFEEDSRIL